MESLAVLAAQAPGSGGVSALTVLALVFGGSGIIGGIVALMKYKGESTAVLVSASGEVVVMQKGMIESLKEELAGERADWAKEREDREYVFRQQMERWGRERSEYQEQIRDMVKREREYRQRIEEYERRLVALESSVEGCLDQLGELQEDRGWETGGRGR